MQLDNATIAVTGATGFLGGYLVEALLARSARVIAVVRNVEKARGLVTRLDAVLCCDETGRYIASIEIPQLVEVLAEGFTEPA